MNFEEIPLQGKIKCMNVLGKKYQGWSNDNVKKNNVAWDEWRKKNEKFKQFKTNN